VRPRENMFGLSTSYLSSKFLVHFDLIYFNKFQSRTLFGFIYYFTDFFYQTRTTVNFTSFTRICRYKFRFLQAYLIRNQSLLCFLHTTFPTYLIKKSRLPAFQAQFDIPLFKFFVNKSASNSASTSMPLPNKNRT
jgi:hypothetical protein